MAYSPDPASSNFHTFPRLLNFLGEQLFHDEESLKKVVNNFFERRTQQYATGINKLIDQYKKCRATYGENVKK